MTTKASPRSSNSSSASSSSSSSRRGPPNSRFIRERDGNNLDRWEGDSSRATNFSTGWSAKAPTDQRRGHWEERPSQTGVRFRVDDRGPPLQHSLGGNVGEIGGRNLAASISDRREVGRQSWRSDKEGGDRSAGGRWQHAQPSNRDYGSSRDLQRGPRDPPFFPPREERKEHGGIRGSAVQTTRLQARNTEDVQTSRFQARNIEEGRGWERHWTSPGGQDAYVSSETVSSRYLPRASSFKTSTGVGIEARGESSERDWSGSLNERAPKASSRGWKNPNATSVSLNFRHDDGFNSTTNSNIIPQSETRGGWRQKNQEDFGVRNVDIDGSMRVAPQDRQGRNFKETMPLNSVTLGSRPGGRQKEEAEGQNSGELGTGGEGWASGKAEDMVLPKASEGSLVKNNMDSEEVDGVVLPFIVGSCQDMCPVKEREQRERLRDLAVFERLGGNPGKTSRELAVKKFCRTFSGIHLQPSDVRPLPVLWSTLQYLLNLLDDPEFSFEVVHSFLFDRTRAIRQELGMQRIANSQAISMYEEIVRFHILSEHELCQRGSGGYSSDSHLNLQQLSKTLTSLLDLYRLKTGGSPKNKNEAEFRAYYVLLNLGSHSRFQAEPLSLWFRQVGSASMEVPEMNFARKVLRCYRLGNFKAYFQLAGGATYLQGCLMELHFNEVRLRALAAINQGGYKLHPIPLADIAKLLLLKEGDLEELCNICGLSTGMDSSRIRCLLVKQSHFSVPKEIPWYRCPCIGYKRASSYYEQVSGVNKKN